MKFRGVIIGVLVAIQWMSDTGPLAQMDQADGAARVVADTVDVYDGPDERSFVIGRLRRGSRVQIRERQGNWLAIEPPTGAFCWIDARVIEGRPDGTTVVLDDGTVIRSGVVGARMPGPPRLALRRGVVVRLMDLPVLSVGEGRARRIWRAIEPPSELAFYVRAESVAGFRTESATLAGPRRFASSTGTGDSSLPFRPPTLDDALLRVAPSGEPQGLEMAMPPELRAIEAGHRAALQGPLDTWRLADVRRRYGGLLETTTDPTVRSVLRGRLDHLERQQKASDAARRFRDVLLQSRSRDRDVEQVLADTAAPLATPPEISYDGVGLLQQSSRLVDGNRVHALIGADGYAEAYLKMPPGLNPDPFLSRQVGVRGSVGYDAGLRARVINVREIVPLSAAP